MGSRGTTSGPARTAGRSGSVRAGAARATGAAAAQGAGRRADRRSARALRAGVLGALAVVCLLSVLSPLATYVREQSSTASLTRQVDQATRERASLDRAVTRWEDPAFVAAQARARLHYVRPGETGYVVLDLPPASADPSATGGPDAGTGAGSDAGPGAGPVDAGVAPVPDATTADGSRAWYDRLWRSVEVAGQR